jgi:hypothetical protein
VAQMRNQRTSESSLQEAPSVVTKYRPRRGPLTWGRVALIWASGVASVLIIWGFLGNGKPTDWLAGVATALTGPTAGIIPLAMIMRQRSDRLGPDDNFLES